MTPHSAVARHEHRHFVAAHLKTARRLLATTAFTAILLLSACRHPSEGEATVTAAQTQKMQDAVRVSVGRLSLDAPSVKKVDFQKAEVSDIALTWIPLPSGQSFATWLTARTAEINTGKLSSGRLSPMIRSYKLPQDLPAVLYWAYPKQTTQRLEAYRAFNDYVLVGTTDGYPNELPISERLMPAVMSSFQRTTLGTPVSDGFAVDGGVVHREFENNETADATATLHLPAMGDDPDDQARLEIHTEVFTNAGSSTLPARMRRAQASIALMQAESPGLSMKTLRGGPRIVAGLKGDESFTVIRDPKDHPDTYAAGGEFEFGGDANNPTRPYLQITLNVPEVPNSFDSSKLLTLWDQILPSTQFHR